MSYLNLTSYFNQSEYNRLLPIKSDQHQQKPPLHCKGGTEAAYALQKRIIAAQRWNKCIYTRIAGFAKYEFMNILTLYYK